MSHHPQYAAFLSYSHRDQRWASWLHRNLETYRLPQRLRATTRGDDPLRPIFRDRDELAASGDLNARIEAALASSRALIVLCSPDAAASRWTNAEIATFKRLHPDRPILAAIVGGEPYASAVPGSEALEAFPPALRFQVDRDGALTDQPAEPIAADFRATADGRRLGKLKIIAGLLGVGLDDLVRRETRRRNRRFVALAAGSLAGMALTSGLAVFAFRQRTEAVRQREQADGLIEFMLTDLRAKLDPVGRLDVLDSVGERAVRYYAGQDVAALDADALGRRARALQLVGEVATKRGNLTGALAQFRQAAATTAEQLRRDPDNGQRIFDHAQSVFWVGYIAWQRGDNALARRFFTQYRDHAARLAQSPKPEWRAELGHANVNLGVLDLDDGQPNAALRDFEAASTVWQRLHGAAPGDRETTYLIAQAHAWEADARHQLGDYPRALADRATEIAIYRQLKARDPGDMKASEGLSVAWLRTAQLQLESGAPARALASADLSQTEVRSLQTRDPSNALWTEMAVKSANIRAEALMMRQDWAAAADANVWALDRARKLVATDRTVASWRTDCLLPAQWMNVAILHRRSTPIAARAAIGAVSGAPAPGELKSPDARFARIMLAVLSGVTARQLGEASRGATDWAKARAMLPPAQASLDARFVAAARLLDASPVAPPVPREGGYDLKAIVGPTR